jgi:hypothetical protein
LMNVGLLARTGCLATLLASTALGCGKHRAEPQSNPNSPNRSANGARGSWTKRLGDANAQSVNAVAVDASGGIFAAGYGCGTENGSAGKIDFGAGPKDMPPDCGLFVVAYTQDGQLRWSFTDGERGLKTEADALAPLPGGGVLVAGDKDRDLLLSVLSPGGATIASHRFPHSQSGSAKPRAVSIATDGDWLVAGVATTRGPRHGTVRTCRFGALRRSLHSRWQATMGSLRKRRFEVRRRG